MPWRELTTMSQRSEFVQHATSGLTSFSELCRQYGISRKTGYKWCNRLSSDESLADRPRRPHNSPWRSPWAIEELVVATRLEYGWGGRKIRAFLLTQGVEHVPSTSTVTAILRRHGLINAEEAVKHRAWTRFEMTEPNELWQMDFKGYLSLNDGSKCHPLTVLDDYSRYLLTLAACLNETGKTVREQLTVTFKENGLPSRMLMDNGSPWGCSTERFTALSAWLIRLGITVLHGRPFHPQTQGKDERLHRTMVEELLNRRHLVTFDDFAGAFSEWRHIYNCVRPHESLGSDTPAQRYRKSPREMPAILAPIHYDRNFLVRKVDSFGQISIRDKAFRIGKAFCLMPVGLRPTEDGVYDVFFCHQKVREINLRFDDDPDQKV